MTDKSGDEGNPEVAVEEVPVDEYSEAWDEADKLGEKADLSAADDPKNAKEEEPAKVVEPPKVEKAVEPPVVEAPKKDESEETYEQRYKTLVGIRKHDKELWESEKAQYLSQLEETKKPKEVTPEQKKAADDFVDSLTDEQKKQLEEYEQDFDVVSKMEGIKRTREFAKLRHEMKKWQDDVLSKQTEIFTKLTEQESILKPIATKTQENEVESHFNAIRNAHNDFETYRDDGSLQAWIDSKPNYIKKALQETYSGGTASDVIEMITDFKQEKQITISTPENVVHINPKKAEKKQALTAVTSRRGAINLSHSLASDYESAWDEANAKLGG